jgi:hypothetical protein
MDNVRASIRNWKRDILDVNSMNSDEKNFIGMKLNSGEKRPGDVVKTFGLNQRTTRRWRQLVSNHSSVRESSGRPACLSESVRKSTLAMVRAADYMF